MSLLNKRYEIIRPIKSGGFGEVYLAQDHNLGIDVAWEGLLYKYSQDQIIQLIQNKICLKLR